MNANPYLTDAQRTVFERAKIGFAGLPELGFSFVTADLDGYCTGSMNKTLPEGRQSRSEENNPNV